MTRIGLNAHLLSGENSYRSAGVSRYIANLLRFLPRVDAENDYVAFAGPDAPAWEGWDVRRSAWHTARPPARITWRSDA